MWKRTIVCFLCLLPLLAVQNFGEECETCSNIPDEPCYIQNCPRGGKRAIAEDEEAKHFITLENLDERIEECLDNPKNYNFAIDKEGRVAKRSALP